MSQTDLNNSFQNKASHACTSQIILVTHAHNLLLLFKIGANMTNWSSSFQKIACLILDRRIFRKNIVLNKNFCWPLIFSKSDCRFCFLFRESFLWLIFDHNFVTKELLLTINFVCRWKIDCPPFFCVNLCSNKHLLTLILNERVFQVPFKWLLLTYFSVIERRKWNDSVFSQTCVTNESSFFETNDNETMSGTYTSECSFEVSW